MEEACFGGTLLAWTLAGVMAVFVLPVAVVHGHCNLSVITTAVLLTLGEGCRVLKWRLRAV